MLVIPLVTTNLQREKVSVDEKRKLAPPPEFYNEDGSRNTNYSVDFENWINDNIGQRSKMIVQNAKIQYYLFNVLSNNSDKYLGPNGELNYATSSMILDYQHKNLYSEERLAEITDSFQYLKDYVEGKEERFYYFQCWDKHSIYPEYFPQTVIQYGETSKTELFNEAICNNTDVNVISPREDLIDAKETTAPYSKWGDPTHWSQRGAYIGYLKLMNAINADSEKTYKILRESDYNLTIEDQGSHLFGGIHIPEDLENFEIKNPKAVLTNEKLTLLGDDQRHGFYTNEYVDNDTRLLIIGDSYFNSFIVDDIAESFHEVIMIWNSYAGDIQSIIDEYNADIVVVEAAERCDRTGSIIKGVNAMKGK